MILSGGYRDAFLSKAIEAGYVGRIGQVHEADLEFDKWISGLNHVGSKEE